MRRCFGYSFFRRRETEILRHGVGRFLRFTAFLLFLCLLLTALSSCGAKESPYDIVCALRDGCAVGGVIYAPSVPEGETGYCDGSFFAVLYGEDGAGVRDYAVLLLGRADMVGECAVFVCRSAYDAIQVAAMCERRLDLLRSLSGTTDISPAKDGFILRRDTYVAMCALPDNERARRLLGHLL